MSARQALASAHFDGNWRDDPIHQAWLAQDASRQLDFFKASLRADGGLDVLDWAGKPRKNIPQELHITTRLVHAYAMGAAIGFEGAQDIIDAGLSCLMNNHRDTEHGGYLWSFSGNAPVHSKKLAYGHVFVLLAAASAKQVDHPDADRVLSDVSAVLEQRFWDDDAGLFREEFNRDWSPFSKYRGMNANMHGTEALLAAFEATEDEKYLTRAGRILGFFIDRIAIAHDWRVPEHFNADWQIDPAYAGDPMFRPLGTTPGHSLELGRLLIQHWDLSGRTDAKAPEKARALIERALADAWQTEGGLSYTLDYSGAPLNQDRYWWPVAEAIVALNALQKCDPRPEDETWYRRLWQFAHDALIDHENGGWFPEIDAAGQPCQGQFIGKPDIYHSLQAALLPLTPTLSKPIASLKTITARQLNQLPR